VTIWGWAFLVGTYTLPLGTLIYWAVLFTVTGILRRSRAMWIIGALLHLAPFAWLVDFASHADRL